MTLNGVMALVTRYFTEFGSFRGALRKMMEDIFVKMFTFAMSSHGEFIVFLRDDSDQVVYTQVRLSPSSIIWYPPKDNDALRIERQ